MTTKIVKYIEHNLWSTVTLKNYLLLPLSLLYGLFKFIKYNLFQNPLKFSSTIICVGSPASGGYGKTPVVIRLVKILSAHTHSKIAVVTKGYKGTLSSYKRAIRVELEKNTYQEVGDEALLIANYTDVFISKRRRLAIKMAERNGAKIIILDDGFQDNSIFKNYSILTISTNVLGNNANTFIIPAGPMRESFKTSIKKSDIIIMSDYNYDIMKTQHFSSKDLFYQQQVIHNTHYIKNKKFVLLCGIARPERVIKTINRFNAIIIKIKLFPDHYKYSIDELKNIYNEAKCLGCNILTTTKDLIRIDKQFYNFTTVIDYSVKFSNEKRLVKQLLT